MLRLVAVAALLAAWSVAFAQSYPAKPIRLMILTPAKTIERIRADHEKWGKVVKEANIRAE